MVGAPHRLPEFQNTRVKVDVVSVTQLSVDSNRREIPAMGIRPMGDYPAHLRGYAIADWCSITQPDVNRSCSECAMNLRFGLIGTILGSAAGVVGANVVSSTVGSTTTFKEDFNGGTSFSACWYDAPLTGDDSLFIVSVLTGGQAICRSSSFTFSSPKALKSLTVDFWYSVPGTNNGRVTVTNTGDTSLPDVGASAAQFLLANPGVGSAWSAEYTLTLHDLAAGSYTVTFGTVVPNLLAAMKVDDVTITATAVPEPATYFLVIPALSAAGLASLRRRRA